MCKTVTQACDGKACAASWRSLKLFASAALLFVAFPAASWAASGSSPAATTCTQAQFTKIIEATGKALRTLNAQDSPRLRSKLAALRKQKGWSSTDTRAKSQAHLHDARMASYDRATNALLGQLDQLGEAGAAKEPDCGKLRELQVVADKLVSAVRAKSAYTLAKLDRALEPETAPAKTPAAKPPATKPAAKAVRKPVSPQPSKAKTLQKRWKTTTAPARKVIQPPQVPRPTNPPDADAWKPAPMPVAPPERTFSFDEIRSASRGFFGTVSGGLAGILEHAFSKLGRPSAYVLGKEGGGAFLAGVRYGEGKLFTRVGKARRVYWHGPSIGYDIGAAGSRTMFLVYNLRQTNKLFAAFSGIDGSAYLVGGVGITFLTDGHVVMAPIRSGVGLRLGASIGYVRFTPRRTWNPF